MSVEEERGLGDDGLEIQVGRQLGQREVEHVGLLVLEQLVAPAQDDLGEDVDAEDLLARDQGVEEPRDVAVALHVVREHGQRVREREVRLVARQVLEELRVYAAEEVRD